MMTLISKSLRLYFQSFWKILTVTVIMCSPMAVFTALFPYQWMIEFVQKYGYEAMLYTYVGIVIGASIFLNWMVILALSHLVGQRSLGKSASIWSMIKMTLVNCLPLVVTAIYGILFVLLRTLIFIIPGIKRFFDYTFSPYILMFRQIEGSAALKESQEVISEQWWRVCTILFAVLCVKIIIWFPILLLNVFFLFEDAFIVKVIIYFLYFLLTAPVEIIFILFFLNLYFCKNNEQLASDGKIVDSKSLHGIKNRWFPPFCFIGVTTIVCLVTIGSIYGWCWYILSVKPVIRVDYVEKLNQLVRLDIPEEQNGWHDYQKAFALYKKPPGGYMDKLREIDLEGPFGIYFQEILLEKQNAVHEFVNKFQLCWEQLDEKDKSVIYEKIENGLDPVYEYKEGTFFNGFSLFNKKKKRPDSPRNSNPKNERKLSFLMDDLYMAIIDGELHLKKGLDSIYIHYLDWVEDKKKPMSYSVEDLDESEKRLHGIIVGVCQEWIKFKRTEFVLDPNSLAMIEDFSRIKMDAFEYLKTGANKYFYPKYATSEEIENLNDLRIDYLSGIQHLSEKTYYQSLLNLYQNDMDKAIELASLVVKVSCQMQNDKLTTIEQFYGMRFGRLGYSCLYDIIQYKINDVTDLDLIESHLKLYLEKDYPKFGYSAERLTFESVTQASFTEGKLFGGRAIPRLLMIFGEHMSVFDYEDRFDEMILDIFAGLMLKRDRHEKMTQEYFDYLDRMVGLTPYQQSIEPAFFEQTPLHPSDKFFEYLVDAPLLSGIYSSLNKVYHDTLKVLIEVKKYHLQKNEYPDSLEELLQKKIIDKIPDDPFCDQALQYQVLEDRVLLYSCGWDLDDDGGQRSGDYSDKYGYNEEGGDWIVWQLMK